MHPIRYVLATLALLGGLVATPAHAAEGYDSCTHAISALPVTISAAGTWCLSKDLGTAISSGAAIEVMGDDITIDCNGYKLGGLQAGTGTGARGIHTFESNNITIRNCTIRGFRYGIFLSGGSGHLVEDNLLDQNTHVGINVRGDDNRVQRNRVYATGGADGLTTSFGIDAAADVIDNTVAGVSAAASPSHPYGIRFGGNGTAAIGNQVRDLQVPAEGIATGIGADGAGQSMVGNHVTTAPSVLGQGILGQGDTDTFCRDNQVAGFSLNVYNCHVSANMEH